MWRRRVATSPARAPRPTDASENRWRMASTGAFISPLDPLERRQHPDGPLLCPSPLPRRAWERVSPDVQPPLMDGIAGC